MPFWTFAYNIIEPTNRTCESFQKGIAGFTFAFKHLGILSKSDDNSQHISRFSVMFNTFCFLLIICDILSNHMLWIIFWARWWCANVYKDQEGDPRWFDALSAAMSMGCGALAQFWGLLKMPEVALGSRRPSPTIHPVLYVSCNCLACSSLGAFQPRAGLAKRWALASVCRWACALLQRASADADTSFSFFFGSVVEYCAAQQKLKAWLW